MPVNTAAPEPGTLHKTHRERSHSATFVQNHLIVQHNGRCSVVVANILRHPTARSDLTISTWRATCMIGKKPERAFCTKTTAHRLLEILLPPNTPPTQHGALENAEISKRGCGRGVKIPRLSQHLRVHTNERKKRQEHNRAGAHSFRLLRSCPALAKF